MKIVLIWPYFFPEPGAAASRGLAYFKHLKKKHEVYVISRLNNKLNRYPRSGRVTWLPLYTTLLPWHFISDFFMLYKKLKYHKPNLVVVSVPGIVLGLQMLIISKLLQVVLYLDARDILPKTIKNKLIQSLLFKGSKKIIITTKEQKHLVNQMYKIPIAKLILIPNGISDELLKIGPSNKKRYDLVFYGTLIPERNLEKVYVLIEQLIRKLSNIKILFVGHDPKNSNSIEFVSRVKSDFKSINVEFYPEMDHVIAFKLMREAKIGLISLSSSIDFAYQIPVKTYEYLAAGIPVAALLPTHGTAIESFITENSCGVADADTKELSDKIIDLLNDPEKLQIYSVNNYVLAKMRSRESLMKEIDENI